MNSGNSKNWYIRLNENFFGRPEIKIIKGLDNGDMLVLLYIQLMLLTINSNGVLEYSKNKPYTIETLASVLGISSEIMKQAIETFTHFELVNKTGKTFYIEEVESLIGYTSKEAERKATYRKNRLPEVKLVKRLNKELILFPDGSRKYIDETKYNGNGAYAYDLANCVCELCKEKDIDSLEIYQKEDKNDIDNLYILCSNCLEKLENTDVDLVHRRPGQSTRQCPPLCLHNSKSNSKSKIKSNNNSNSNNIDKKDSEKLYINESFDIFWERYPKKLSKKKAEESFKKLKLNEELLNTILSKLEIFKRSKQWSNKQYIPYPATWLNQERWKDEDIELEKGSLPSWFNEEIKSEPMTAEEKEEIENILKDFKE